MLIDFGCTNQPDLTRKIFSALPGAAAGFATVAGLAVLGALLNRSKRFQAHDIFCGFSVVVIVMTLATVFFAKSLPFVTLVLFVLIALAIIPAIKRRIFVSPFWLIALFPGLFIMTAINIAGVAKWDDFSHWVPNALYVFLHDSVPRLGLPAPHSAWPGYPYAVPFVTYMESWLTGGFLVQGGAMVSFLLFAAFASMLVETLSSSNNKNPLSLTAIGTTAFALVYVVLLNPGFAASFSITNEGDTPTTVLLAALALFFWQTINALRAKNRASLKPLRLPAILIGTALVLVKQSDLSLLGLLTIGFLVVGAKNRILKPALVHALLVIVPALILRSIWQHYVDINMPGQEFSLQPFGEWRFDLIPFILLSMLKAMIKANGLTVLMLGVTIYGGISLFRPANPSRNFALMTAITFAGYICFLLMAYVGAGFGEAGAKRAASFYRYCTHTSLLGMTALWMFAPAMWKWFKGKIGKPRFAAPAFARGSLARVIGIAFLLALLPILDLICDRTIVPQPGPQICAMREFGRKLAAALPDHSAVVSFEPETAGLYTFIVNLDLTLEEARSGKVLSLSEYANLYEKFDRDKVPEYVNAITHDSQITAILVPPAEHAPLVVDDYDNSRGSLVLLRDGAGWKRILPE